MFSPVKVPVSVERYSAGNDPAAISGAEFNWVLDPEDENALKILQKLAKQGKESASLYVSQNRQDLADDELAQVAVIETYLPKKMSETELEAALREIIANVGATSMKDMGKVMGTATKQLAGKAEGSAISTIVKKLLA